MNHNEKGSATLHTLFAAVLLMTALAAAVLWSTISTARHKLATAADLTALSAAQSLTSSQTAIDIEADPATYSALRPQAAPVTGPVLDPCATAARVAALHKVHLAACDLTSTSVTVRVALELDLRITHPTLAATSRAGPV